MERQENAAALPTFSQEEACLLRLRARFERRGYHKVQTAKFEDYALYGDNTSFLGTERMLTFTDPGGRLLALKPDVTLSLVKHLPEGPVSHKLYYLDEVCRLSPDGKSYKVLGQIGVECIGESGDAFADLEVLDLALACLGEIDSAFALDVSHLGFVGALLEQAALDREREERLIANIHQKNAHDIAQLLDGAGVAADLRARIVTLAGLHGPFRAALDQARALVSGAAMEAAFRELERVEGVLNGHGERVNLDFSVVNDLNYYNALIFRGYIKGVPAVVLSGGRYDNLMKRMGKGGGAVGFGVRLDQLSAHFAAPRPEVDVLVTYGDEADGAGLLRAVRALNAQGRAVRCEREGAASDGIVCGARMRYRDGTLEEVVSC